MRFDSTTYRPRLVDSHLGELVQEFAAVMIVGARSIGKTSTASQLAAEVARLDQPGVAAVYRSDPDAALRRADRPLVLDEWQEVPEILPAVKRAVDRDPSAGRFILTGSIRAELTADMWPATGRVIRLAMYPLVERELSEESSPRAAFFIDRLVSQGIDAFQTPEVPPDIDAYISRAVRSGFPDIVFRDRAELAQSIWLESYVDDVLMRDAATEAGRDAAKLRRWLAAVALNNAGMPSDATLYQAADINARTSAAYDRLLQNMYLLDVVPAWTTNRLGRLVKQGKRYLIDAGFAATAAGLDPSVIVRSADLVGRWFDAFATAQLRAEIALMHPRPSLHHLRVGTGRREIDLVVELGAGRVVGLEFKAGVAPDERDAQHLSWLRDELGDEFVAGAVIHAGPGIYELGDRIFAIPLCALWT